jgi:hypothetical protein
MASNHINTHYNHTHRMQPYDVVLFLLFLLFLLVIFLKPCFCWTSSSFSLSSFISLNTHLFVLNASTWRVARQASVTLSFLNLQWESSISSDLTVMSILLPIIPSPAVVAAVYVCRIFHLIYQSLDIFFYCFCGIGALSHLLYNSDCHL